MRIPFIAGNWKMYKTRQAAVELVTALKPLVRDVSGVEIAVAPPFTALSSVAVALAGSNIALAAQNLFWEAEGAYTGEISPLLLKDIGCQYVIIGHSERRQYFGETNKTVHKRIRAALTHGLRPICCVGETLAEREGNQTFVVIEQQVTEGLETVSSAEIEQLVIAYEPVWAIGTGKTATPAQANEVHAFIRALLQKQYGAKADQVRIQYGGSVKPENVAALMAESDIDGALVGGASLTADSFARIVKYR
jgi:triosephosphate isomerase